MAEKNKYEVTLSFGSWAYLAGLLGLTGGFVVGIVSAVVSALSGEWLESVMALILAAPFAAVSMVLYALVGYPIYKYLAGQTSAARTLEGVFVQTPSKESANAP